LAKKLLLAVKRQSATEHRLLAELPVMAENDHAAAAW